MTPATFSGFHDYDASGTLTLSGKEAVCAKWRGSDAFDTPKFLELISMFNAGSCRGNKTKVLTHGSSQSAS